MNEEIKIYTLSTCSHCKALKKFLSDHGFAYIYTDVDLLSGDDRKAMIDEVRKYNPSCSFPTVVIGKRIIIGFNEGIVREVLNL